MQRLKLSSGSMGALRPRFSAYLAKNDLDPFVLHRMPWCLVGYAVGVVFGAYMMFCAIRSLDYYNVRWRNFAFPDGFPDIPADPDAGKMRIGGGYAVFGVSDFAMAVFLFSSILAGCTLSKSTPPQTQAQQQTGHLP